MSAGQGGSNSGGRGGKEKQRITQDAVAAELMRAFSCYEAGRFDEMEALCGKLLRAYPGQPDAIHLQGLLMYSRGQHGEALALIDRAIRLGGNDSMHANRGMVLCALGRHQEAIQACMAALRLNPSAAPAFGHLGNALQALGRWEEGQAAYVQCLRLKPGNAAALNAIGYGLLKQDRRREAYEVLSEASRLAPQLADVQLNLGVALRGMGRPAEAERLYRRALELDPQRADAWYRLGTVLTDVNRIAEAKEAFAKAHELQPTPIRLLRKLLILSHVYPSHEAMLAERSALEAGLDELLQSTDTVLEPDAQLFSPAIFNLAYQGHDVLPTLRKMSQVYLRLCPGLVFRAPHVDTPRVAGAPLRLGFFSAHVEDHPVSRCYAPLICALALDPRFEVLLISNQPLAEDAARNPYRDFRGRFIKVPHQVYEARTTMADLALDVLVYQDIGMDDVGYFLAYARLARRQCVLGGHPVTTGLPEMDIYVTSALGDAEDAQAHYSERLVRLDPGIAQFEKPRLPDRYKGREELDLPSSGPLYVCPMMLQKLHPDFDAALAGILEADPHGHVVLFGHPRAGWEIDLKARLDRSLPASVRGRVIFLPWMRDAADFAAVNKHAAVVLDPFHFGIGSTAVTTFAVGTPFVTWPTGFLRGRVGLVYSRLLGIEECVASDPQDYVRLAVRIANDEELRASISARILDRQHRFFNSQPHLESMRQFFVAQCDELDNPHA